MLGGLLMARPDSVKYNAVGILLRTPSFKGGVVDFIRYVFGLVRPSLNRLLCVS